MKKILNIRLLAIVFFSNLLVIISYEMKPTVIESNEVPKWLIATVIVVIGVSLAKFMVDSIFKFQFVRKWAIGNSWVEGFWLIETFDKNGGVHPITKVGILSIQYNIAENEIKAVTTRVDEKGIKYVVNSEFAYVREEGANVKYLNYFKLSHPEIGTDNGVAFASFSSNTHSGYPNTYTGNIALEKEDVIRVQSAQRISDKKIKEYKKKAKDGDEEWIVLMLKDVTKTNSA